MSDGLGVRPTVRHLPTIRRAMWCTDVGLVVYWVVTFLGLVPREVAYKDYDNPILMDWNYSFVPLDLLAGVTGFVSLALLRRHRANWHPMMIVSLTLTSVAGLQALSFWLLRGDFSLGWWLPNAWLLLFPVPAILGLRATGAAPRTRPRAWCRG